MKVKGIVKKFALVLAVVVALSAVWFGVAKLVEFVKDDLKTITPVFDVGNLGTDGKFVDDESTLYTKEAFACDGLQIKLDFDNQIEYQIYFYDDLDNFVESTEVLSAAYSETVHDGYARIVIMPTNEEDEKISLTERVTYPGQMTIKVAKEQNVQYYQVYNKRLRVVNTPDQLLFSLGSFHLVDDTYVFDIEGKTVCTNMNLLSISSNRILSVDDSFVTLPEGYVLRVFIYELSENDGVLSVIKRTETMSLTLSNECDFVIISAEKSGNSEYIDFSTGELSNFGSFITLSK